MGDGMRFSKRLLLAAALACPPSSVFAQTAALPEPPQRAAPTIVWAPKPDTAPYVAPNRPLWRLAELLRQHSSEKSWSETLVRDPGGLTARYIQMAPGEKTKAMLYVDSSMFWFVQAGQMRVTIQGQEPFIASKGFVVQVPAHTVFQMETVGDASSLRFEVTHTRSMPFYPADEMPAPIKGVTYQKAAITGAPGSYGNGRPYLDFQKEIVDGGGRVPAGFIRDGETAANIIRAPGAPRPPDSERGHFHDGTSEFWFVLEGEVDFLIEGEPFIQAMQGDIVYAPAGRWHRSGHAGSGMDTRVSIHPIAAAVNATEPGSTAAGQ
jgi:mannose-6-phosphate isomerase-like protein (cupin superfamily)